MSIALDQPRAAPRRPGLLRQVVIHRADYLYVLPALAVMMVVIAYPIWFTIDLSFYRTPANLQMKDKIWAGMHNYRTILASASFHHVTINTLIWTFSCTLVSFLLGLGAALALHREFSGRGMLRALLLIPYVVSAVAASYVWKWLYHSDFGVFGAVSVQLGLTERPINFLDNIHTVLPSLIVVQIWREFSFAMIMMMAGLQTVPEQLLRAAQVDGANTWQRFRHVTMPHLKGVTMVTLLLLLVSNFNSFIVPYNMNGGAKDGASDNWITHI
jgi:multiple sugar transport system permease protein